MGPRVGMSPPPPAAAGLLPPLLPLLPAAAAGSAGGSLPAGEVGVEPGACLGAVWQGLAAAGGDGSAK
jgi:hypothetical protein